MILQIIGKYIQLSDRCRLKLTPILHFILTQLLTFGLGTNMMYHIDLKMSEVCVESCEYFSWNQLRDVEQINISWLKQESKNQKT